MLRLAIFASLFAAILSGAWATFLDPTPENASKILNPSAEQISQANGYVSPVLNWIKAQTPESIGQLFRDAASDVKNSIEDPNAPVIPAPDAATGSAIAARPTPARPHSRKHMSESGAPTISTSTSTPAAAQDQPGIDWYTGKN